MYVCVCVRVCVCQCVLSACGRAASVRKECVFVSARARVHER